MKEIEAGDVRKGSLAGMVDKGGEARAMIARREPRTDVWSAEEFKDAMRSLDEVDFARMRQSLSGLAVIARCQADDLIQELYVRVLDGKRHWPKDKSLGEFVYSAGRSVANAAFRRRERSPYRSAVSVTGEGGALIHDGEDFNGSPEDQVIALEALELAEKEVAELFRDDESMGMISLGRQDGMEGEPLRQLTGLGKTEFESKCRKMKRRLNGYRAKMEASR